MRRRLMMHEGGGRLPSGYQEVEYLQGTGTQYIDTGILCRDEIVGRAKFTGVSDGVNLIGSPSAVREENYRIFSYQNMWYLDWGGDVSPRRIFGGSFNGADIQEVEWGSMYIRDLTTGAYIISGETLSGGVGTKNISLGFNASLRKLFYFQCFLSDTLIGHFIPCYRKSDNVAGMYDLVNGVFYTNQGTGEFIAGPDVN